MSIADATQRGGDERADWALLLLRNDTVLARFRHLEIVQHQDIRTFVFLVFVSLQLLTTVVPV